MKSLKLEGEKLLQDAVDKQQAYQSLFAKNGILGRKKDEIRSLPKTEWGSNFRELERVSAELLSLFKAKFVDLEKPSIDCTIETFTNTGKIHPMSDKLELMNKIMSYFGFEKVSSPVIDDEFNNFEVLNVGKMHPARDMQDTFYLNNGQLLRTQTTSMDFRTLLNATPNPGKFFHIGEVYRRDDEDKTHSSMFFQLDGLYVDHEANLSFNHLKWFLSQFIQSLFESDKVRMRFRPSYFPFTEPSLEVDILCVKEEGIRLATENDTGEWLEILGGGMLCKNILQKAGYMHHHAMAFGLGVNRIVLLKHQIANLNDLYRNRLPFLNQYGVSVI